MVSQSRHTEQKASRPWGDICWICSTSRIAYATFKDQFIWEAWLLLEGQISGLYSKRKGVKKKDTQLSLSEFKAELILMHNIQIRPENPCWARCDCDSHLMKPRGPAASIWLRLPSYNASQATRAPGPSLITDNERKESRERLTDGGREGVRKRKKKKPQMFGFLLLLKNSTAVSSTPTKSIPLTRAKPENSAETEHTNETEV